MGDDRHLIRLEAEARHASQRYRLYKARTMGPGPTDPARLRRLERERERAETRLRRARTDPNAN